MAEASADAADPVEAARERLEIAVARLESAFSEVSEKSERDRRDAERLMADSAELKRQGDAKASRDARIVQRLDRAIERLRQVIESQP